MVHIGLALPYLQLAICRRLRLSLCLSMRYWARALRSVIQSVLDPNQSQID